MNQSREQRDSASLSPFFFAASLYLFAWTTCERVSANEICHTWISHVSSETQHLYRPSFSQLPYSSYVLHLRAWVPTRHVTHMNQSREQRDSACLSPCFFAVSMYFFACSTCECVSANETCHTHESVMWAARQRMSIAMLFRSVHGFSSCECVCQWGVCHTWIRHVSSETPASLPPCLPFICMYTYEYICIYMHICIHICIYVYIYICIYMYIYDHIYMYRQREIYRYTYMKYISAHDMRFESVSCDSHIIMALMGSQSRALR